MFSQFMFLVYVILSTSDLLSSDLFPYQILQILRVGSLLFFLFFFPSWLAMNFLSKVSNVQFILMQFGPHDVVVLKQNKADSGCAPLGQGVVYRLKVSNLS